MFIELNINGILNRPGASQGWTDRAVTLAHLHLGLYAEKLENFTGVFTRMLYQDKRAEFVADIANKYLERGWSVYLRGHSNGCDIIRRALFRTMAPIDAVQLIAPAVDPDFERNGMNQLLRGKVKRLVLCGGPKDSTLKVARLSHPVLNLFGNGYGTLGLTGPRNLAEDVKGKVTHVVNLHFDHSDWVAPENLLSTLKLLHQPAASNGLPRSESRVTRTPALRLAA